jgi:hypothetical protein
MIFSILLTTALLGLTVYALLQKSQFPLIAHSLPLVCLTGVYFAWFPEMTAQIAHRVGVGRGTDLMLYVWLLASGFLFLVLHLKLVTQDRKLTELARAIALAQAIAPSATTSKALTETDGSSSDLVGAKS